MKTLEFILTTLVYLIGIFIIVNMLIIVFKKIDLDPISLDCTDKCVRETVFDTERSWLKEKSND